MYFNETLCITFRRANVTKPRNESGEAPVQGGRIHHRVMKRIEPDDACAWQPARGCVPTALLSGQAHHLLKILPGQQAVQPPHQRRRERRVRTRKVMAHQLPNERRDGKVGQCGPGAVQTGRDADVGGIHLEVPDSIEVVDST